LTQSGALNEAKKRLKTRDCLIFDENRCGCFVTVSQLETLCGDFGTRWRENNLMTFLTYNMRGGNVNPTLPDGTQPNGLMISRAPPEPPLCNAPRPLDNAGETDNLSADELVMARHPAK